MAVNTGPVSSSGGGRNTPTRNRDAPKKLRHEDVTYEAARNKVIQDIAVHPLTVFPVVAGVLGGLAMVVVAANPFTLGITVGGFFVGGASFIWNYFTTGEERVEKHLKDMMAQAQDTEDMQVQELQQQCESIGFAVGAQAAGGFLTAYINLLGYLKNQDAGTLSNIRALARNANREAVQAIESATAMFKALRGIDIRKMEGERGRWERDLAGISSTSSAAESLRRQIEAHDTTIAAYRKNEEALAAQLATLRELEAALQKVYLKTVGMASGQDADNTAAELLANAVEAQERLLGLDQTDAERRAKREKYRKRDDGEDESSAEVADGSERVEAASRREQQHRQNDRGASNRDAQRE